MSTRKGREFIDPCSIIDIRGDSVAPYLSILINNIQIWGKDSESAPPEYIVRTLAKRGAIAYDRDAGEWFAYSAIGERDRFGYPKKISVIQESGRMSGEITVGDKICIYPANALFFPPVSEIIRRVATLEFLSVAMAQNVNALKQATALIYEDADLNQQIDKAERDRLAGKPTVKIYNKSGSEIRAEQFSAPANSYLLDFLEVWKNTKEELDAITGRATVGEKTERRITEEISVIENAASTSIDVMIDTFNAHSKRYGINAYAVRGSEIRINTPKPAQGAQNEGVEAQNEEGNINDGTE